MKIIKIALSQIMENAGMFLLVIAELLVALISFNISFSGVYQMWQKDRLFQDINLSRAVSFTVRSMDGEEKSKIYKMLEKRFPDMEFLGFSLPSVYLENGSYIRPLSREFVQSDMHPSVNGEWFGDEDRLSVIVPESMSRQYRAGCTYKLVLDSYTNETVDIYVCGSLKRDLFFFPPQGVSNIIESISNTFIAYDPQGVLKKYTDDSMYSGIVTAFVKKDADFSQEIQQLQSQPDVSDVLSVSEARKWDADMETRENSVPVMLTIAVTAMCFAGFLSYNLLSVIQKEKQFAVFFLSGASWKKCLVIQLIKDTVTLFIPFALALAVMLYLDMNRTAKLVCTQGVVLSFVFCLIIFFTTSFISVLRLAAKQPVDIIKRW